MSGFGEYFGAGATRERAIIAGPGAVQAGAGIDVSAPHRLPLAGARLVALRALSREAGADIVAVFVALAEVFRARHGGPPGLEVRVFRSAAESAASSGREPGRRTIRLDCEAGAGLADLVAGVHAALQADPEEIAGEARGDDDLLADVELRMNLPRGVGGFAEATLSLALHGSAGSYGIVTWGRDAAAEVIEALGARLAVLVDAALAEPRRDIARLDILPPAERRRLLDELNDTRVAYPRDRTIPELFSEQALRTPSAVALVDRGKACTFAELEAAANRLAHYLRAQCGVGRDASVAVMLESSERLVVAMLAVLKAGGAYLPIDPSYPRARIDFMLGESRAVAYLADGPHAAALAGRGAYVVDLEAEWPAIAREPAVPPARVHALDDLAYIIYTSGSTGRPKGILQTHRCLANFVQWQVEDAGFERGLRVLQFAALSFDVSVQEILFSLLSGGCLFLITAELRRDLVGLARFMAENEIEVADFPFSVISVLVGERLIASARHLRHLISAGEPLQVTPELAAFLHARPGLTLHNHYGPSETHMLTNHAVSAARGNIEPTPPLGRFVSNMQGYVLDPHGEPVPFGVVGEIFISGAGVARGYLDPALTCARFLPHPFRPGERIYRTGDVGRFRFDGALEILGRVDHQVKVRGFRIELGEIERTLLGHPSVRHAVVVARETQASGRELVAYVVGDVEATAAVLRAHLQRTLPAFMIPAHFLKLDRIPLSPHGKVDRAALPAPSPAIVQTDGDSLLHELLALWSDVLGVAVGPDDELFDLGCDSLMAVRGVARTAGRVRVEVSLRDLYEARTVGGLAERIAGRRTAPAHAPIPVLPPRSEYPASEAQRSLWIFDQIAGDGRCAYNFTEVFRVRGPVDLEALRAALHLLQERHESLRTTFHALAGTLHQRVHPAVGIPLEIVDLDERADPAREARRLALVETERPFELDRGPLVRACLLRCAGDEALLLVSFHHIISDAWSVWVFERDLSAAYAASRDRVAPSLPPLASQYRDFVAWQEALLAGPLGAELLAALADGLAGDPPRAILPPTRAPAARTYRGESFDGSLSGSLSAALRSRSRAMGASLLMCLLGGFVVALHRRTGQRELVLGGTAAGRPHADLEHQVGLYANLVPLRIALAEGDSYASVVHKAKSATLAAQRCELLPFTRLLEALDRATPAGSAPVFDVGFQMIDLPPRAADAPVMRLFGQWAQRARNHLWLTAYEGAEIRFTIEYNTDLYDRSVIERFFIDYVSTLEELAGAPDRAIVLAPSGEAGRPVRTFDFDFSA